MRDTGPNSAQILATDPTGGDPHTVGRCLALTKALFFKHWGPLTLMTLIAVGANLVAGFIPFAGLLVTFATPVLYGGACQALLEAERRGERARFEAMFGLFKQLRALEVILIWLIMYIISILLMIPLIAGSIMLVVVIDDPSVAAAPMLWVGGPGLILFSVVALILLQLRVFLAMVFSVDKDPSEPFNPLKSIERSWSMTKGHVLVLLCVWAVVAAIAVASILALCIGYVLVAVQASISMVVATYLLLLPPSQRGGRFADASTCPWCGYDLSTLDGVTCPECGRDHPARGAATASESGPIGPDPMPA